MTNKILYVVTASSIKQIKTSKLKLDCHKVITKLLIISRKSIFEIRKKTRACMHGYLKLRIMKTVTNNLVSKNAVETLPKKPEKDY